MNHCPRILALLLIQSILIFSQASAAASITQEQFDDVIQKVTAYYQPIAARHGQGLTVVSDWDNPEPNAHSQQNEGSTEWRTIIYGGMARRPEMTLDAFTLVACHEIGHHLGGYPMYVGDWGMINSLSSEGQADYYAAQSCLRALWSDHPNSIDSALLPTNIIEQCEKAWKTEPQRKLCQRIILAGKAAADTWAAGEGTTVSLKAKDPYIAPDTNHNYYPSAQCRLDTYVAGAMCSVLFNDDVIPGRLHPNGQESEEAWEEAKRQSCLEGEGKRPLCWFNPESRH